MKNVRIILCATIAIVAMSSELYAYTERQFKDDLEEVQAIVDVLVASCDVIEQHQGAHLADQAKKIYHSASDRVFVPGNCARYSHEKKIQSLDRIVHQELYKGKNLREQTALVTCLLTAGGDFDNKPLCAYVAEALDEMTDVLNSKKEMVAELEASEQRARDVVERLADQQQ